MTTARPRPQVIPLSGIIDSAGIAERHGISRQVLSNWKRQFADFPKPLNLPLTRGNHLYDVAEVDDWMEAHTRVSRTLKEHQ